ncbi:hypothetical protein A8C56_15250 [Niabella ginsenosidivorans]|uniref:Uncharacterized protein n=1 Tax=Niabella ginsenosidivorans TaxID=1176587 RepID=A0A1A9I3E8_9BACT|nr:hypothetical protein [Niabella ginsenosidivorans]ANH82146.1 hypothetical protein A8C56_15250 [Niabella ginsenosidivorans]
MSLNKIDLPPRLIAQLYPRSLMPDNSITVAAEIVAEAPDIETASKQPPVEESSGTGTTTEWKSLGGNQKNIMVIVDYTTDLHLPDPAFTFLSQILNACKLGPNDVVIINRNNYPHTPYEQLLDHFTGKVVLLFGTTAAAFGFPFEIPPYQVQTFAGYTVMHAPALDALKDDKPAKTQLWSSFKKIFNL